MSFFKCIVYTYFIIKRKKKGLWRNIRNVPFRLNGCIIHVMGGQCVVSGIEE